MYSATLGRFMQTDPIGYGDGMNWYNYGGSDPVNATDPFGLAGVTCNDGKTFSATEVASFGDGNICDGHGGTGTVNVGGDSGGGGFSSGGIPASGYSGISSAPLSGGYIPSLAPSIIVPNLTSSPQNNPQQDCGLLAAISKNKQAIIGDTIGLAASALPGGKPAVALAGLALGAGILTNTAMTSNTDRPALSIGSISLGIAGYRWYSRNFCCAAG